jgi:phosphoribosylpyrophosphate synthetase
MTSSHYDTAIFNYFNQSAQLPVFKQSIQDSKILRYGENPHQSARFYGPIDELFKIHNGKELSYNNMVDVDASLNLIADLEIDAVAFVPPTIPRKTQIMTELQKHLNTGKPLFKVEKIKTPITIPQKALSKLYERVANAKNTFAIPVQVPVKRLLLIDDAVGSGATMNEIALKIKQKGLSNAVLGVAITGSYKGFEVISEL